MKLKWKKSDGKGTESTCDRFSIYFEGLRRWGIFDRKANRLGRATSLANAKAGAQQVVDAEAKARAEGGVQCPG